jgi:RNase P/RNase MRP subunit POP5
VARSFSYQFGLSGSISAGLYFLEERSRKDFLVIRVNHENVSQLRAAIAAITQINGVEVVLWVSRISGTVKSLMKSEASKNS